MLWENYIENHKLGQDHVCSSTYHVAAGLRPCLCLVSWLLLSQLVVAPAFLGPRTLHDRSHCTGERVGSDFLENAFSLQPSAFEGKAARERKK